MKRFVILLSAVLSTLTTALAAEEAPRARYLVATRKPAREVRPRFERDVPIHRFNSVNGFAAELTAAEVAELRQSRDVLFIEPDVLRYALGSVEGNIVATASTQQVPYGIDMVNARKLWDLGRGRTIRVAVIDTGIEKTHPDLIDDFKGGHDFLNNDDDPNDDVGHGTHVAGTIGALDNDFGVVGVAPDVEIYALKVLGGLDGSGPVSAVIRAIDWAIEQKMHVINMSLGSDTATLLEEAALQRAADAGIIAIAASGNAYKGLDGLTFPAAYSTVISVGAINDKQQIASFSQRGSALKLVAPGVAVQSTTPTIVDVQLGGVTTPAELMEGSPRETVTGNIVFCGFGATTEIPESVRGNIALIERNPAGDPNGITFREKSMNAKNAGAVGVIIFNRSTEAGPINGTLIRDGEGNLVAEAVNFPFLVTVGISRQDGEMLRGREGSEATVSARVGGYGIKQGTSMATPHVAGVAALIWSIAPNATAAQVRQAVVDGATDLGAAGFDTTFGFGLVNALESARRLVPEKFATPPRSRRTGRP